MTESTMSPPGSELVAWAWAGTIAENSYVVMSRRVLADRLVARVEEITEALTTGARVTEIGREIGKWLVDWHFTDTSALAGTMAVLGGQFCDFVASAGYQERMHLILGEISASYARALRERTLSEQQQIHAAVNIARDKAEKLRRESQARFQAIFNEAATGIAVTALDGKVIEANRSLCEMLGHSQAELAGMQADAFRHPSDDPLVWSRWGDVAAGRLDHFRMQKAYFRGDGEEIWTDLVITLIRDAEGQPQFLVGMVQDITDRHRLLDQMRHQATHDPLTSLPNRTVFFEQLAGALSASDSATQVGVCFLDLDGFKAINDTLGHVAGDQLLREISRRLATELSGPGRVVARMGGDEFVVLIEDPLSEAEVIALALQAQAAVREPVRMDGHTLAVTACVGVLYSQARGSTAAELMKKADTTLYWAKSEGRDRWALFDEQRHTEAVQRYQLAGDMPIALREKQFFLEYQPIVDLADGCVTGVEALLRWQHPELGRLAPDEFIELAEHTGLIVPLGHWVLEESCRQAMRWRESCPDWYPVISVNVSPRQLAEPDFVAEVGRILAETGIEPRQVQLELTESALMTATGLPLANLHELAAFGIRIALDDFGTGYSNLAYLGSLPLHTLKLAGPFIAAVDSTEEGADAVGLEILSSLVQLAHTLRLTVVAEGVETTAQAEVLAKLHCDLAQGWHYSRAVAPEAIPGLR